ncbi:GNAT family N-acetyltransferase [Holospora curviuscula]|uniref:GNAT family N-acetyltransferase n=1 Tax=Holospora curviuscula TaxID=1082868 RepID=UPI001FAEB378|nr:GNAT family N-acetyltransferase [Holospora curviuscula]
MNGDSTYFIGEEVTSFEEIDKEFETLTIPVQNYAKFTNQPGPMPTVCIDMGQNIWKMNASDLGGQRAYIADFEVYDQRSENPEQAVLDILYRYSKMNISLLKSQDTQVLEEYLAPHKAECMFICSNLKATGIEYGGSDFEGEYFGYFDKHDGHLERLLGVIIHYWNGNVMMHAEDHDVLEKLILHLKKNISRSVAGILGPNIQAEHVIKKLGLLGLSFGINSNEGLYEINLEALNELSMPSNVQVVSAQNVPKNILIEWMKSYDIEALGALNDETVEKQVQEHWNLRLQKNDSLVLLLDETPVALSPFNARFADMVQVGPVWTPPEYRNKGFARLLLAYTLYQEKLKGKKAILFTDNPAEIKVYLALGFKKIGNYRLTLLEKPVQFQEI